MVIISEDETLRCVDGAQSVAAAAVTSGPMTKPVDNNTRHKSWHLYKTHGVNDNRCAVNRCLSERYEAFVKAITPVSMSYYAAVLTGRMKCLIVCPQVSPTLTLTLTLRRVANFQINKSAINVIGRQKPPKNDECVGCTVHLSDNIFSQLAEPRQYTRS